MSQVVVATAYGGPEVLEVVDRPPGAPGSGEVLLTVRAAGVNPIDWKLYGGMFGTDPAQLPMRLGYEAAGTVAAAGKGVALREGDEVVAFRLGAAYAEQVVVPSVACVPRPPELDPQLAGGLLLAGTAAWHAVGATHVAHGETVLVHGASGAVGRMAAQLALLRGAGVIGTASPAAHDDLRALGVEPVAYGEGLEARVRAAAPDGVDVAIDAFGGDEAVDVSLTVVADRQRIATLAAFQRGPKEGILVLGRVPGADHGTAVRDAARSELVRLAAEGRVTLPIRAFALADVAEAHRAGMAGDGGGKLVLVP